MTEQEKVISQLCIEMQWYCEELRNAYCIEESYNMDYIEYCIERIHRLVNPDFDKICEDVEAAEREENNDESGN